MSGSEGKANLLDDEVRQGTDFRHNGHPEIISCECGRLFRQIAGKLPDFGTERRAKTANEAANALQFDEAITRTRLIDSLL